MTKPILCLDFDGVLHSYTSGWQGISVIPDPPVEGAIGFLWDAVEKFQVCIFSSRSSSPEGIAAMRQWLNHYDELYWEGLPARPRTGLTLLIDFPTEKPAAFIGLDDRVLTFTGEFPSIDTLLKFQPWNKKPKGDG